MQPFTTFEGLAAPMYIDNIDTDAIIPSKETQSVSRTGYGEKLFAGWRYLSADRQPNPDFVLNKPPFERSTILVAGRNFGCGSSREAAVWALAQFGFRTIIAESFGAIFRNNCIRNGLLPIAVTDGVLMEVRRFLEGKDYPTLTIDLEKQIFACGDQRHAFQIGARDRNILLLGLDEIAATLLRRDEIRRFRAADRSVRPWLYRDPSLDTSQDIPQGVGLHHAQDQ